jgi:hypothetical protein
MGRLIAASIGGGSPLGFTGNGFGQPFASEAII